MKDDLKFMGAEVGRLATGMDRFATKDELKLLGTELRGEINLLKWMYSPVALVALVWISKEAPKVFGVTG
ncbi:MAG TPA: hypothetical protein VGC69_10605 [Bordetella sp.]